MKLPPYPKYKPTGVEWLGEVPEHWEVRRLKHFASINDEALPETTDPGFEMSYVDISSVDPIRGIVAVEDMVFEDAPSRARRVVRDGDTIVSTVRTYLRAIAPVWNPASNTIVSTGFAVVHPRRVSPAFLSCALREAGLIDAIVARSVGVSYPAVNTSEIGTLPIPLPAEEEQLAIADFLDRETAKIDTLVAKKQTLIERLKEKRTALISRTVTRGLPPAAARAAGLDPHPMLKLTGIEWLGEVPEHWEVRRLKHFASINDEALPETTDPGFEMSYVDISSVDPIRGIVAVEDMVFEDAPSRARRVVRDGDTIVSTVRTYLRAIAPVWNPASNTIVSTGFAVVHPRRVSPAFLSCALREAGLIDAIVARSVGVSYPAVNTSEIGTLPIPLPAEEEQLAIADFLDRETAKIDSMVAKIETAIERMQEYRNALITAAVTGKIDVREAAA